jgi:hypothetical protein
MPRPPFQDCIRIVWRITHVFDRVLPSHDEHCAWGPRISVNAKVVPARKSACLDHTRKVLGGLAAFLGVTPS